MVLARFCAVSLTFASLIMMSACTYVDRTYDDFFNNPISSTQSMPKGYTYQDDTPLSSPAPSSPWDKSAAITDSESIGTQNAAWQGAAFELVDKMETNLPKDGTPLNLLPVKQGIMKGSKDNALDHHLRQVLLQKGYNLTTIPDAGLQVTYKVEKSKTPKTYDLTASILDKEGKAVSVATVPAVIPK